MNLSKEPREGAQLAGHAVGDIDLLLSRYFQSALPKPWPSFLRPAVSIPVKKQGAVPWRSRLTLAASVAFLLLGSAWLATRAPEEPIERPSVQEATHRKELHKSPEPESPILPASKSHH